MYTIKQASARTGLSIPTIRVWERRYGVVEPARTPAGYRLYDEAAIGRLSAMRHLIEAEGWRPSQAAQRVIDAGDDAASLIPAPAGPSETGGLPDGAPAGDRTGPAEGSIDAYIDAARSFDVRAMETVLDDVFAARRFERAMDDVVFPALRAIGSAWAEGDLDVAQEHVASETVRRRLARYYDAGGRGGWGKPIVIGLPPGGQHELGALSFAVASRRAGIEVLYLGPNVPLESWLRTMGETGSPMAVLAVFSRADAVAAQRVVDELRAMPRPPLCVVGGPGSLDMAEGPGTARLPLGTDAAIAATVALLAPAEGSPG